jgi:hypothetical protein
MVADPDRDYRAIFHTSPFARHIYKDRAIPTVPAYSQMMFQIAHACDSGRWVSRSQSPKGRL